MDVEIDEVTIEVRGTFNGRYFVLNDCDGDIFVFEWYDENPDPEDSELWGDKGRDLYETADRLFYERVRDWYENNKEEVL